MKKRTIVLVVVTTVVAAVCIGGAAFYFGKPDTATAESAAPVTTATVERGDLSQVVSASGTLTYRARPDGTPYVAINQASGIYTALPATGDAVGCGDTLYRVDDKPVLLLCGELPQYRDLEIGATGADVAQLNRNLDSLGYDQAAGVEIDPADDVFSWSTWAALTKLQHDRGQDETGELARVDAVVLPSPVRVGGVPAQLGTGAQPGTAVVHATSDTLVVQVSLDPSQRADVLMDSPVLITLPGSTSTTGKVAEIGRIVTTADGQGGVQDVKILVTITLDNPEEATGLDHAPVRTQITTAGVQDVLSVPVVALVGNTGGGYAVDVLGEDGSRSLVPVTLGLFDQASGRVQVEGDLTPGDAVVVPS
ncbi:efflux RND transporter periplasmic adaptor subunit [Microbacterium sp.]|uniref:efflux RND transporter periplasmic adaptor subunit n=1 Tax=Microbacterium sp. TaxID=51671 RepID=UPI0039E2A951